MVISKVMIHQKTMSHQKVVTRRKTISSVIALPKVVAIILEITIQHKAIHRMMATSPGTAVQRKVIHLPMGPTANLQTTSRPRGIIMIPEVAAILHHMGEAARVEATTITAEQAEELLMVMVNPMATLIQEVRVRPKAVAIIPGRAATLKMEARPVWAGRMGPAVGPR